MYELISATYVVCGTWYIHIYLMDVLAVPLPNSSI